MSSGARRLRRREEGDSEEEEEEEVEVFSRQSDAGGNYSFGNFLDFFVHSMIHVSVASS